MSSDFTCLYTAEACHREADIRSYVLIGGGALSCGSSEVSHWKIIDIVSLSPVSSQIRIHAPMRLVESDQLSSAQLLLFRQKGTLCISGLGISIFRASTYWYLYKCAVYIYELVRDGSLKVSTRRAGWPVTETPTKRYHEFRSLE